MVAVRIRSPNGAATLDFVSLATTTFSQLREAIQEKIDIPAAFQQLRIGFPPVIIAADTPEDTTLADLNFSDKGEVVIVARLATPVHAVTASPAIKATVADSSASLGDAAITASDEPAEAGPSQKYATDEHQSKRVKGNAPLSAVPAPTPSAPQAQFQNPSAPASTFNQKGASIDGPGAVDYEELDGGYLTLRVVPDDNSCLFRAVGLVLQPGTKDAAGSLREVVAKKLREAPELYDEATLGQSPASYIKAILKPSTWGGAIELAILSAHYGTEICSIDVQTGRADRFGQGEGYDGMVLIVYSGIHYDALTFSYEKPTPSSTFPPPNIDFDTTVFPSASAENSPHLAAAVKLVAKLRARHAYTDAATFTLRCEDCNKALVGEKEAREHAKETGHARFGEYDG